MQAWGKIWEVEWDDVARNNVDAGVEIVRITISSYASDRHLSKLHDWVREDRCFRDDSEHTSEVVKTGTIMKNVKKILVFLADEACWRQEMCESKRYLCKQPWLVSAYIRKKVQFKGKGSPVVDKRKKVKSLLELVSDNSQICCHVG